MTPQEAAAHHIEALLLLYSQHLEAPNVTRSKWGVTVSVHRGDALSPAEPGPEVQ